MDSQIRSPPHKKAAINSDSTVNMFKNVAPTKQTLVDLAANVLAKEIAEHTDYYLDALHSVPAEYLKVILPRLKYVQLDKFHQSGKYKDVVTSEVLRESLSTTENYFRELFVSNRNDPVLDDPHLMLINVFENVNAFVAQKGDKAEAEIPRVFPLDKKKPEGEKVINSKADFQKYWRIFTEKQLEGLDWTGVFVAGGSVLACAEPMPESVRNTDHIRNWFTDNQWSGTSRNYYYRSEYNSKYAASDIDLFLYDMTPEQATQKLRDIYNVMKENLPVPVGCVRTPQSVTFVSQFPFRNVQVILRLYKSPAEVLMGFDLDCVTVGYDGNNVWCLPRFYRAVTRQYNLIDLTRRSTTYESRLFKYSKRGFEVAVPGLNRDAVDKDHIMATPFNQTSGLSRLLYLENKQMKTLKWGQPAENGYWRFYNPKQEITEDHYRGGPSYLDVYYRRNPHLNVPRRIEWEAEHGEPASDYSNAFLPWGPNWTAAKIFDLFYRKSMSRNYEGDDRRANYCHGWAVEDIIISTEDNDDDDEDEEKEMDEDADVDENVRTDISLDKFTKRLKWLTIDPGRQYIGSFHPEPADPALWEKNVYSNNNDNNNNNNKMNPSPMAVDNRPPCRYGASCYRKNPQHLAEFKHPPKN